MTAQTVAINQSFTQGLNTTATIYVDEFWTKAFRCEQMYGGAQLKPFLV